MAIAERLDYHDLPELLTLQTGDEKHDWSALSTLDVLWVLYDRVRRVDSGQIEDVTWTGSGRYLMFDVWPRRYAIPADGGARVAVPRGADWSARDVAVFSDGTATVEDVKPRDHRAALYVMRPGRRAMPVTQAQR